MSFQKLLCCGLSCLLFASSIDFGYWVRNGRVMKTQRNHYASSHLASVDLEMVQFALVLIGYLGKKKIKRSRTETEEEIEYQQSEKQYRRRLQSEDYKMGDDNAIESDLKNKQSEILMFDPFFLLYSEVFR